MTDKWTLELQHIYDNLDKSLLFFKRVGILNKNQYNDIQKEIQDGIKQYDSL